ETMNAFLTSLLLGLTAAAANVFGGVLIARRHWRRDYLRYFVALGSGFMLATALLEMVPEGIERAGTGAVPLLLVGYLLVHFFEHTITAHFHFGEELHPEEVVRPGVGTAAVLGMIIHAFFDGAAIAAGFIISPWLGAVIFVAIFLHKIPDGFTVASVMIASGRGPRSALAAAGLMGAATVVGVGVIWLVRAQVAYGLLLSAGATLYVAASDLLPEVNREPGIALAVWVFAGVGLMLLLKLWLPF
ncbi:MAG: ZIP family metal transporter, partial [Terriglobia bacterium]